MPPGVKVLKASSSYFSSCLIPAVQELCDLQILQLHVRIVSLYFAEKFSTKQFGFCKFCPL